MDGNTKIPVAISINLSIVVWWIYSSICLSLTHYFTVTDLLRDTGLKENGSKMWTISIEMSI